MHDNPLEDIAAAEFDHWNDLQFPDLPPIHPANDSRYQTEPEVIEAWHAAIDKAAPIAGSRDAAVELYRICRQTTAEKILAKAAKAKHPANYVATSLRNHYKRELARKHGTLDELRLEIRPAP
jgi:hypothetical protein